MSRRRGVAALEFALVAPVLCVLALGTVDVVSFLRLQLRLEQTATELATRLADAETLREADLAGLLAVAPVLSDLPALTGPGGRVVLSGVANTAGEGLRLRWQRSTGTGPFVSQLGSLTPGGAPLALGANPPALVREMALAQGQSAVVAEVFLSETSWVLLGRWGLAPAFSALRAFAAHRPRVALLLEVRA